MPGYPEPDCRHVLARSGSRSSLREQCRMVWRNEYIQVTAREKGVLYEANPMVNCDEPEAVFGTSLA